VKQQGFRSYSASNQDKAEMAQRLET